MPFKPWAVAFRAIDEYHHPLELLGLLQLVSEAIIVFVDRLTKMTRLAACHDETSADDVARLFIDNVFRSHGMPRHLLTDRDSRFRSHFTESLLKQLNIAHSMSSSWHPETDGNTERVNRVMEDMLRHVVSPDQTDWDVHLPVVEFAINNAYHESIQNTPFMLNYGRHPDTPVSSLIKRQADKSANAARYELKRRKQVAEAPAAKQIVEDLNHVLAEAKKALHAAQPRQKAYADAKRTPVTFAVGQKVFLSTENLNLRTEGTRKRIPKYVGPFSESKVSGA